jgi:transcriptional regulator with XRE-family HTH domain
MRPDAKVGQRIKRVRLERGLSQRHLADGTSVSYAYVSRIEAGARVPSLGALIELADRLDTSALYLATGRTGGHCPFCGRRG